MVPPVPADPKLSLAGILFGVGDELRHRLGRHRRVNLHDHGQIGDQRQHPKIPHGIVRQFLVEHRIEHDDRRRRDKQRVAVGLGTGHRFGADGALRTGLVLDEHRLLQIPAEKFGHQSAQNIGRTARGIGNDKFDRTRRITPRRAAWTRADDRAAKPMTRQILRALSLHFPRFLVGQTLPEWGAAAAQHGRAISQATICQPASRFRRRPRRQKSTAASR